MNFEELLDRGYREYNPPLLSNAHRTCQKRFDDGDGNKLYFISVYLYTWDGSDRYEAHIQLYQKETHCPLDLNFFNGWSIADIEEYAEFIYNTDKFEPYEMKGCD